MERTDIRVFLDQKVNQYKRPIFIEEDPIQIPLRYTRSQDQEIAGLLAATIAWGQRRSIITDADKMMQAMEDAPYDFVRNFRESDLPREEGSIHRTFMYEDFRYILRQLQRLYASTDTLETYFMPESGEQDMMEAIERFRQQMLIEPHRASKHISSPARGSAAKRLNMYLRWMVRDDDVDLGIWQRISPSMLSLPLDVHTARVARGLGLLERRSDDRRAVEELDARLREYDPVDPVRYDFALFGLGVYEDF